VTLFTQIVANGPRVDISAGIPAWVRTVRDGDSGSAPGPEDSQIWSAIVRLWWMTAVLLSHIFVLGYGLFFVDALMVMLLGCYLSLADAQASSHSRWPETALKLIVIR